MGQYEKEVQKKHSAPCPSFLPSFLPSLLPSCPAAHSGTVRGVAVDTLNQLTFSTASDQLLKFWRFKTKKLEEQLKLTVAPASMLLHRDR